MARIDPLDFSQARVAPESVMRGLEEVDPTACIVHLGGARWLVGKVRPNAHVRAQAEAMFANWTRAVRQGAKLSAQGQQRVRFAQLAMLGFRPVETYQLIGAPDGRIVKDFRRSRHRWLTTSDAELQRTLDDPAEERRAAAHAEIASVDRAKDAWRYAFTRSFMPSAARGPVDRVKAGWQRVASIA